MLGILGGPPVSEVSVAVELAAFIVESMSEFVSYDAAPVAIVRCVRCAAVIQRRLKYASGKVNIIGAGVVIGVHSRRSNKPLPAIDRLANFRQLAPVLKGGSTQGVAESVVPHDDQVGIVSPMVGIPDLVSNSMQLFLGSHLGGGAHPIQGFECLVHGGFDVLDHLQRGLLVSWRKFLGDVDLSQSFTQSAVRGLDAAFPAGPLFGLAP